MTPEQLATQAAIAALDFEEGNLNSLTDAEPYFTPAGWADFLAGLKGFTTAQGAPVFSSRFTPGDGAATVSRRDKDIEISIPGTLRQSRTKPFHSVTVYRAVVQVKLATNGKKIVALKTRTCGGAKTVTACR